MIMCAVDLECATMNTSEAQCFNPMSSVRARGELLNPNFEPADVPLPRQDIYSALCHARFQLVWNKCSKRASVELTYTHKSLYPLHHACGKGNNTQSATSVATLATSVMSGVDLQ